jgi:hypothetical protein
MMGIRTCWKVDDFLRHRQRVHMRMAWGLIVDQ